MRLQPSSGRILAATLTLSALAAAPDAANAALQARATMSPTTIHYPGTRTITYRLELTTGDEPEVVRVSVVAPTLAAPSTAGTPLQLVRRRIHDFFRFLRTGQLAPVDSPIAAVGDVRVTGAGGRIPDDPRLPPGQPRLRRSFWMCDRGYPWSWRDVTLRLPPNSTTSVTARYRTGDFAPWPDTDYRVQFAVARRLGDRRHYVNHAVVRPARPLRRGRADVRISLRSRPVLHAAIGRRVHLSGRTEPPLRNRWIQLRLRATRRDSGRSGRTLLLANVRSDRTGRFAYRAWRAAYHLTYRVWAEYRPVPGAQAQPSCPVLLFTGARPYF